MSYCVNCGVELDASAKKCALCSTPIYNPANPPQDKPTPYSDRVVLPAKVRRRFSAFIVSMILLLPNIVCLLINLLVPAESGIFWAKYVNTTSLLAFVLFIFPFLVNKLRVFVLILIDMIAILGYIFFFYWDFNQSGWFLGVALPMVIVFAVFAAVTAEWGIHKKPDWPILLFVIFLQLAIYAAVTAVAFYMYFQTPLSLAVPVIVAACCVPVAIFFLSVKHNRRLRAWLSRRFFV